MLKIAKKTSTLPTIPWKVQNSSTLRVSEAQEDAVPYPLLQTKFQTESFLKYTQTKRKKKKGKSQGIMQHF